MSNDSKTLKIMRSGESSAPLGSEMDSCADRSCAVHGGVPAGIDTSLVAASHADVAKENRDWIDALFDGVETGIFIIDPESHTLVDANTVAATMVGAPREHLLGRSCHQFICPAEKGRCPVTDLGQTVDNSERLLITAGGEQRAIIKTVRTVELSGQKRLLESFLDITNLKRTERTLKERTTYLNSLIEATPIGVVVIDSGGCIEMSNAAFARLFQHSRSETLGANLRALILPEAEETKGEEFDFEATENVDCSSRRRCKDGSLLNVRIIAVALEVDRKSHGRLILYEDISRRIETERSMAEQARLALLSARIGIVLTGSDSTCQALQKCAEILVDGIGAAFARVWTLNERERMLELQASAGMYTRIDGIHARVPVGSCEIGRIGEKGEAYFSNNAIEDGLLSDPVWAQREGMIAFVGYPLKVGEAVLGVVAAFARQSLSNMTLLTFASVADNLAQFIERKRAEESLRESENQFRTAFEAAPYGMCMTALDGRFLNVNAALCAMLGYTELELQGVAWQRVTYPEDLARSRRTATEIGEGEATDVALEKRYIHKNGQLVSVRLKISPVRFANGSISHFITHVEDVTLQRQADQAQAFLASLVESSEDAIIGKALDGTVVSWNRGAEELYGYSVAEMVGESIARLVPPDRAEESRLILECASRGEPVSRLETVRLRKDGKGVDVALTVSSVRDATGQVTGIVTIAHDITERRRREQQTHLQTAALESAANGVVISDREGRILWVNPAFTRLTGYTMEEAMGQNPRVLKSGHHDATYYGSLWATILRGETWHGEIVNRRKDGSLYDEEMTITPVREPGGAIHHFVAIKQDISERKRAQMELQFKTTLLETEAETTIDGILVVDQDGRRIQSNRRFAEIFHIPAGLLAQGNDQSMLAFAQSQVRDPAGFLHRVKYLYSHPLEKARDEIQMLDGRCLDRYTAPLHDAESRLYGRVWYFRDITDRKNAEQAIRDNERRYRELFENASEIIFTIDLNGRFTSLNRAGERALGYSQEEAAQIDIFRLTDPEYWEAMRSDWGRLLTGEKERTAEIEFQARDNRSLTLEVKLRLIRHGDDPNGIQAIARDITGRDIAELELRHAQKLESVGRLAAGIAHEINTPIQFIGDNTRFLEDSFASLEALLLKYGELRDAVSAGTVRPDLMLQLQQVEQETDCSYLLKEIPQAVSQMLEGVERVATIVRAMKEFAHPEGKEMAPADLNKALLSTITVSRNEWKYVAEVETYFGDLPLVACNVGDVNQVFLNLLVNAAHAIADARKGVGKGKITIRTALAEERVHISIADTGTGIPVEIRKNIFDPFFTTKQVGRGTGQGLAIARSIIVERHKGTLTFESEVGKGTTFHIRLPITVEESAGARER